MSEMAFADVGGARVRYDLSGPEGAPVVVLSHSLGMDLTMWDPQVAALTPRFRVLRYDGRGHGETTVTPGEYSIEGLARDVTGLLDALGIGRVHFCGLSIGGLIGIWLGAHAGSRIGRLALCNTASRVGTVESWTTRIRTVNEVGTRGIAPAAGERWFSEPFRKRAPGVVARAQAILERTSPLGYAGCCAALRDADLTPHLSAITAPTLVISGRHDPATTPALGRALAAGISGARYVELEASHLSNIEAPEAFAEALAGFLDGAGS
jgi:3-oxoadipate enol-lactonase